VPYADDELSAHGGAPVELIEFLGPQIAYRYTTGRIPVTYVSNTYAPSPGMKVGPMGSATSTDPSALAITISIAEQVVRDYGFSDPPRSLRLKVYRGQTGGQVRNTWDGVVTSIAPKGRMAQIRSSSKMGDRLKTAIPSIRIQKRCNHFLYDARCRVDRATFEHATTVASVDGATVTVASIGLAPDQWFRAGEIVRDSDGERRLIKDQVGAVLVLSAPFRALDATDAVTMYAGCDHTILTCGDRFNNIVNFGGHPSLPASNPFGTELRLLRKE